MQGADAAGVVTLQATSQIAGEQVVVPEPLAVVVERPQEQVTPFEILQERLSARLPFATPSKSETYDVLAEGAVRAALADAGIELAAVQQVYAGYVYGDSTCGQKALYRVGMTGVPVVNVNNNCSSGSSALFLARQAVASGAADCVLAFGFEQMQRGALTTQFDDRPSTFGRFDEVATEVLGAVDGVPFAPRYFGGAGAAYCERYGMDPAVFAQISVKSRRHAANNPYAVFTDPVSVADVLASPRIFGPLTRLQCCPPTCGAAAAVVVSGRVVTNPSGGLLSKGHPLGATGLAQCAELVWQLRGEAGKRQVDGATIALQHNIGLGGAAVVTLYEKTG